MAGSPRRYLVVPDADITPGAVLRARATGDLSRQEAGRVVAQPETLAADVPAGDIRLTLSGRPETHVEGTLRIARSGPVDLGRYGWTAQGATALQLRQSAMVCGRRTDCVERTASSYVTRPKLLPLRGGGAMLMWLRQDQHPARSDLGGLFGSPRYMLLDPTTDRWSAATAGPGLAVTEAASQWAGWDAVQFPDTGELLAIAIVHNGDWVGTPTTQVLQVWHATDEGAANIWRERCRAFVGGDPDADVSLPGVVTSGTPTESADNKPIIAMAAEMLPSGRIVVLCMTRGHLATARHQILYSLTSDDRGHSWTASRILDVTLESVGHTGSQGVSIGLTIDRGGNLVAIVSVAQKLGTSSNEFSTILIAASGDGVSWSAFARVNDSAGPSDAIETYGVGVVMRPDGWLQAYGSCHGLGENDGRDWLMSRTLGTRDPRLDGDRDALAEQLMPGPAGSYWRSRWVGMHCIESPSAAGRMADASDPVVFGGFVEVDAISYRGQVLLAATVVREGLTGTPPSEYSIDLKESALVVFRAAHWQPLQERLSRAYELPARPADGRIYNRTWDCYGLPSLWGFAAAGAGTPTLVAAGDEGGYLHLDGAIGYADTSLPNTVGGQNGVVRALVWVEEGGSLGSDAICIRLGLRDGGDASGIVVRLERAGTSVKVRAFDDAIGAPLGVERTFGADRWVELLFAIYTTATGTRGVAFARDYDRASDPDWDGAYTALCDEGLSTGTLAVAERLQFGQFVATGSHKSRWKHVHLHRGAGQFGLSGDRAPLVVRGATFIDQDQDTVFATAGAPLVLQDGGVLNVMRASQHTAVPAQFAQRGVSVRARGEALTQGRFSYAAGYEYGRGNIVVDPVRREWRSAADAADVEIVLDGGENFRFRPDAFALFGRNFPTVRIEFGDFDSPSPSIGWDIGWPGQASAPNRYGHLWAYASGQGWSYSVTGRRLTVYGPAYEQPWRPHQFRTVEGGPRYYLAIRGTDGLVRVARIADNTGDTLELQASHSVLQPSSGLGTGGAPGTAPTAPWCVFSDRVAGLFEHRLPTVYVIGGQARANSHNRGYRYVRLVIGACTHLDGDEGFYRLGRLVLGRSVEIAQPDFRWGWSRDAQSGLSRDELEDGTSLVMRRHAPRRSLSVDYAELFAPPEADAVNLSPDEQPDRRSWAAWLDVARRLEDGGTNVALLWEGDRARGQSGEALVQLASDPDDVMYARLDDPGRIEHVAWQGRQMNLAGGAECVPRPICTVRGITFREEF